MALIKCPECDNTISDKAERCPHCGCPLKPVSAVASSVPNSAVSPPLESQSEPAPAIQAVKAKKHSIKKILLPILIVVILAVIGIFFSKFMDSHIKVNDITISKWKLTDQSDYYDTYTATVVSGTKKPFVAVIGYYESYYRILDTGVSISPVPNFVYMENGESHFEGIAVGDDDLSIQRVPVGYLPCETLSEKDIKSISFSVGDYSDYNDTTSCSFDFDIELKNKASGILIFDVSNDMNKSVDYNSRIVIINGKGSGRIYLSDLPVKSRGVEASIHPRAFCTSKQISDSDYTVDKEFTVDTNNGTYSTTYNGEMQLQFGDAYKDGCLIYTVVLTEGGEAAKRGEVNYNLASISNHIAGITTYDSYTKGEKFISPQYGINIVAYVPYNELP